jgi:hypothetical protein
VFLRHCETFRPKQSQKEAVLDCFAALAMTKTRFFRERLRTFLARAGSRRRSAGLTLFEVLVASALLVIAIIPILRGLTAVHTHTVMIERKTMSVICAQAKLDDIKARSIYFYDSNFAEGSYVISGSYLGTVEDDQDPNLRTVSVSVGYDVDDNNSLSDDEVEVSLSTYLAKRW